MSKRGTFIGYDAHGNPIAAAIYGAYGESRISAQTFCTNNGLTPREFAFDDPNLVGELDRWRKFALNLTASDRSVSK